MLNTIGTMRHKIDLFNSTNKDITNLHIIVKETTSTGNHNVC